MKNATEEISDIINRRQYSLWPQFKQQEAEWIGGVLEEKSSGWPETGEAATTITGIEWHANGKDSAWFGVKGEGFSCGFDVQYGGVIPGDKGWITFSGYGGHTWRIKKPSSVPNGNDKQPATQGKPQ